MVVMTGVSCVSPFWKLEERQRDQARGTRSCACAARLSAPVVLRLPRLIGVTLTVAR
jgi:hypothetical protein